MIDAFAGLASPFLPHARRARSTRLLAVLGALLAGAPSAWAASPPTVDAQPDRLVVQRVQRAAGWVGDLDLGGSASSAQGAAIEARVMSDGGDELVGWTLLDPAPSGGRWQGRLEDIPQGGWYRLEVRSSDEPSAVARPEWRFGVGLVVAAIGQSNMVKMFTEDEADGSIAPPFETPDPRTRRYGYGEPAGFEYRRPRTVDVPVSWGEVTGSGGIRLANSLVAALDVPVLILDFALDWTGIGVHWNNDLHRSWRRLDEALQAIGPVGVVVWHQGAYDANELQPTVSSYKTDLDTLYRRITDRVGGHGELPMVVAIQNRGVYSQDPAVDPLYNAVRRAQIEWIDERPHGFAAGTSIDFALSALPGKGAGHFPAVDYQHMADRMTRGVLNAIGHAGYERGVGGGRVARALRRGSRVVVEVEHDHGRRLRLGAPGAAIEGFALTDRDWNVAGERFALPLAAARLSHEGPGNWVELRLGAQPEGPVRLRYLHGQNAFYHRPTDAARRRGGNVLFDDFAYHPQRSGLPIHGLTEDLEVEEATAVAVSASSLTVAEGLIGSVEVRLLEAPGGAVVIQPEIAGDADLVLRSGPLSFDDGTYDQPQSVRVEALPDSDLVDGEALLRLKAPGVLGALVELREGDGDPHLEVAPQAFTVAAAGGTGTLSVRLGTEPGGPVRVEIAADGLEVSPSELLFNPATWSATREVTVRGAGAEGAYEVRFSVDPAGSPGSGYGSAPDAMASVDAVSLSDGLWLHWPLDEASGPHLDDLSGGGFSGVLGVQAEAGQPGVVGGAVRSRAPGGARGSLADGVQGPDPSLGAIPEAATVAFWYRAARASEAGYLFTWGGSYNRADTLSIYLDADSAIRLRAHDSQDATSVETAALTGASATDWRHVAVVKDPYGTRLFLDGELALTTAAGDGPIAPARGITLGTNEDGRYGLEASFDDLRIYGRALEPVEISGLMERGSGAVRVSLAPPEAVAAGAGWRLGGDSALYSSGESVRARPGERRVEPVAPEGWLAPPDFTVPVTLGETREAEATFVRSGTGTLRVAIVPEAALLAGARWRLDSGGPWRASGERLALPTGAYTVTFEPLAGLRSPADQALEVLEGVNLEIEAYYVDEATADPVLHLPLDETAGGVARDVSGQGHDAGLGTDVTLGHDGVFGAALGTRGEGGATGAFSSGVQVPSLGGVLLERVTVSFWYRLPAEPSDGYLFSWGGSYRDPDQISVFLDVESGLRVRSRSGDDRSSTQLISPPGFADGEWHHLAVVTGASGTATYFDGRLAGESPMGAGAFTPPVGLRLGTNENGQWATVARFDDLRAWRRELPAAEVADVYAAGARGTLRVSLEPDQAVIGGARWRLTASAAHAAGLAGAWQRSGARLENLELGGYVLEFEPVEGFIAPPAEPVEIAVGSRLERRGVYRTLGGPILRWSFEDGSRALDLSGNGRHGTYGADVATGLAGLSGLAARTAGTGTSAGSAEDAITAADFAPDDSYLEATVALWYRLDVPHDGYLVTWGGSFNDADHLSIYLDPSSGLRLRVHDADDTWRVLEVAPPGFADGGWHHLVLTTDGDGSVAYFDGVPVGTNPMGDDPMTPRGVFRIGANPAGTFGIEASFDEVAVWDRALSASEVSSLYGVEARVPVTVGISPAQAAAGRWRLASEPSDAWRSSGETTFALPGAGAVVFEPLDGWRTPPPAAFEARLGGPLALEGIYRSPGDGRLRVDLEPDSPALAGARWRLIDGPDPAWRGSGETLTLPVGAYQLELGPALGFLTPATRPVTVELGELTAASVTYAPGGEPILHWPLDDGPAGPGVDVAGFARDARVGSRVAVGLGGVSGQAVQTAGQGGADFSLEAGLETGDFDTDDAYDEATVSLWYRLPAQPRDGYLFAWGGSNRDADHVSAFLDADSEIRLRVRDGLDTTSILRIAPPGFADATWHHLAVVKSAAGSRVYFDGEELLEGFAGSGTITPRRGFFLGMSDRRQFSLEAMFDDVRVWDRALTRLEVESLFAATPPPVGFGGAYRTVDQLHADLERTAQSFPGLVELVDYGDSWAKVNGGHTTPQGDFLAGDDLLAARVTNRAIAGPKPHFVLMACLHAREIATPELAMRFLDWLVEGYGHNADATWLVDHHEVWILPMANPDGHRYVAMGSLPENGGRPWLWRKTVRAGGSCAWPPLDGSSTEGVDLNRNFPIQWGTASGQAGSSDLCSENYRGPAPASEPETQGLMSLVSSLIPDQRGPSREEAAPLDATGLFIQLHSPFRTVSWPWADTASPAPNAAGLRAIGEKLGSLSGYETGQTHDLIYRMTGNADDWVYGELGAPALLIEVGEGLMPPFHRVDNVLWPEMREAFIYAAKIARTPYLTVRGPETLGVVVEAAAGGVEIAARVDDGESGGQAVSAAEAYLAAPPWDSAAVPVPLEAVDGSFDSAAEDVAGFLSTAGLGVGRHTVWVRARDAEGSWGATSAVFVEVP
ncbi:MAG: LamG-like jellyroll fold domain-containing protein [Acidobacteriota bacterium]